MELKIPIRSKVFEALGALADQRVEMTGTHEAKVTSSARDKSYTVRWSEDRRRFISNDNATKWQGAIGYPIIAVLMKLDLIQYDPQIAQKLAGVPWKQLNDRAKRDYERVIQNVLGTFDQSDRSMIEAEADRIYNELAEMKIQKLIAPR